MSGLEIALAIASVAVNTIGSIQQAKTQEAISKRQAQDTAAVAQRNADLLERDVAAKKQEANLRAALGQREAIAEKREQELLLSRARAVVGGQGTTFPSNIGGALERDAEVRIANALFFGETGSQNALSDASVLQSQADFTRTSGLADADLQRRIGKRQAQNTLIQTAGGLASGAAGIAGRF
jgi:hypothetical protein